MPSLGKYCNQNSHSHFLKLLLELKLNSTFASVKHLCLTQTGLYVLGCFVHRPSDRCREKQRENGVGDFLQTSMAEESWIEAFAKESKIYNRDYY